MIIAKTPLRVSLFGGGTDHPAWFNSSVGYTISLSIDKYCYLSIRKLPNLFNFKYRLRYFKNEKVDNVSDIKHPAIKAIIKKYLIENSSLEIVHSSDIPGLSGLASSSAFSVSLINLIYKLNNKKLTKKELAKKSIFIEREILHESVGCQDQFACAYGGFNFIKYKKKDIKLKKLKISKKNKEILFKNLILVYSNIQRKSENIEKDKINKIKKNKELYHELNNITLEGKKLLETKSRISLIKIASLLNRGWNLKKKMSNLVTNKKIDNLYNYGLRNGAIAGKLLGAGGGGYLLFLTKNKKDQNNLITKLKDKVFFKFKDDHSGSDIIYNSYE